MNRLFFLAFYLTVLLSVTAGPRDFTSVVFNVDRDFNGEFIYTIVQDEDGFLWIGSNDGLYRFDGREMLNLKGKDSTINNLVTASAVSGDGHLYLGYFSGGVSIVEHGRYRKILQSEDLPNRVEQLKVDKNGTLWGLTRNKGIIKIVGDSVQHFEIPILNDVLSSDFVIVDDHVFVATNQGVIDFILKEDKIEPIQFISETINLETNALYHDKDDKGIIWFGTSDGLYRYHISTKEVDFIEGFPDHVQVSSIAEDDLNTLWVGTKVHGLIEVDLLDGEVEAITYFNKANGFESNEIGEVYVDNENEVWVGTFGRGMVQLNRAYFHHYELNKSIDVEGVHSIQKYKGDELLLGTENGLVHVYHKLLRDSLIFETLAYTKKYFFTSLQFVGGYLWAGTKRNGILKIDLETKKIEPITLEDVDLPGMGLLIRDIRADLENNIWVSVAGNGVYKLRQDGSVIKHHNTRSGFYHNEIFSIYPDQAGNIWFGSHAVGLAILEKGGDIKYLSRDGIFPAYDVNTITQSPDGAIWITTSGAGIYKFDGEKFRQYTKKDGLLSEHCNAAIVDDTGQIWIGHRLGISLIQPEYHLIRTFSHPSELGETESVLNSVVKDIHGNIFFGNPYGITKVNLPHFNFQINKRETHIKNIRLFYNEVDLLKYSRSNKLDNILPSDLRFGHTDNHLSFDFVSINLRNPDAIYYQYTLEGFDKSWSNISKSNTAKYTNLDPGTYTFKVKESDHPELWDDEYASIRFTVAPPYWRTWWFYLIQIGGILLIMYLTFILSARVKSQFATRLMVYVSLFILFEYVHTEVEPYMESIAGETPIFQVATNLLLALILLPVEIRLSGYLKRRANKKIETANEETY